VRSRVVFALVAAAVLAFLLVSVVARPAVERGGWSELALVAAVAVAVLIGERWLRTR
jgi:hypothetical protein